MGAPPIVMGDRVTGQCPAHLVPGPLGAPVPSPAPLPFSAPMTQALSTTVSMGGKFVALAGSSGLNLPPHVGLHPSDPFLVPATQMGRIVSGSATVLVQGKPVATQQSSCTLCASPGRAVPSVTTVLVG